MSDVVNESTRPPRGLKGDIHRAREGATASAAELREFVRQCRGKSPQEMLGLVAGSSLVQGTILATIITVIFMGAFTVGPYVMNKAVPPVAKAPKPAPAAAPAAAPNATASTAAPATAASLPATSGPAVPTDPLAPPGSKSDIANKLGIGETKIADPKKNPLDAGADDLLKDLK